MRHHKKATTMTPPPRTQESFKMILVISTEDMTEDGHEIDVYEVASVAKMVLKLRLTEALHQAGHPLEVRFVQVKDAELF